MTFVAIVDTHLCNLDSIARAVEECGGEPQVMDDPSSLDGAGRIILPGVGAFPEAMDYLRRSGMDKALTDAVINKGTPFLGICLGMHLMAETGTEVTAAKGLGWIPGEVCRLEPEEGERIPHIGWNEVGFVGKSPLFEGIETDTDFYFVHSYCLACAEKAHSLAETPYCRTFTSIIGRDNIFGVQFHPEKSQKAGFRLLTNFLGVSNAQAC